jgi:hypothetical protein
MARSRSSRSLTRRGVALAAWMAIAAGSTDAGAQNVDRNPLGKATRLTCSFAVTASGAWKSGVPQAQVQQEAQTVGFLKIDLDSGTAEVDAAAGPLDIVALLTPSSVHFLERSFQGNLTVTSVFAPAANGKYRAVRSRHDYLMMAIPGFVAEPTVQQRYGECEIVP